MTILVNGAAVHTGPWETADVLSKDWSFVWTPPGEGVYHFAPSIDHWAGDRPAVAASPARDSSPQPTVADTAEARPDLPLHFYLPLVTNHAVPGAVLSANRAASLLYLPLVEGFVEVRGLFTGTVATIYVDLTPPTVSLDKREWGQDDTLGARIIELTGTASDTLGLDRVEVRIDDGRWDRAGMDAEGRWRWPWRFATPPDGESFQVTVRAIDIAGRRTEFTEQVTVDLVAPQPGAVTLAYVNSAGEKTPIQPGAVLTDAGALEVG